MPIPRPHQNEKEQEFISRFMADPAMNKEYPDNEKRSAIAYSTWREIHKDASPTVERTLTFHLDESRADRFHTTPEGYLVCPARPTRTGVFDYVRDGKLIREYRPPEEVFNEDSLKSLALQPVTYHHPSEMVNADNIKAHQVGTTGQDVTREGDYVACTIKITDANAVKNIFEWRKQGRPVELSCGYNADVVPISGEHPTEGHFDVTQTNIRYNHVGIVDEGRAGHGARMILDNKEGGKPKMAKFKRKGIRLDSFTMDEVDVDIPEGAEKITDRLSAKLDEAVDVIQGQATQLKDAQGKLDAAKAETQVKADELKAAQKKADEVQAKHDQMAEELKKVKADVVELSNMDSPRVLGMLQTKTTMEATADKLKIDRRDIKDPKALKIAIIKQVSPDFNQDGKSDEYINARYDAVLDVLKAAETDAKNGSLGTFIRDASQSGAPRDPRADFAQKSADAWKPKEDR